MYYKGGTQVNLYFLIARNKVSAAIKSRKCKCLLHNHSTDEEQAELEPIILTKKTY